MRRLLRSWCRQERIQSWKTAQADRYVCIFDAAPSADNRGCLKCVFSQPLDIVETLKLNTPATTVTYGRRSTMESLAQTLEEFVFEEVPPSSIKQSRLTEDNLKEYLIEWLDGK